MHIHAHWKQLIMPHQLDHHGFYLQQGKLLADAVPRPCGEGYVAVGSQSGGLFSQMPLRLEEQGIDKECLISKKLPEEYDYIGSSWDISSF